MLALVKQNNVPIVKKCDMDFSRTVAAQRKEGDMETIEIHHHPHMEKELGIDAGHVIIDEGLYIAIMRKYGDCFKTESPPPKAKTPDAP